MNIIYLIIYLNSLLYNNINIFYFDSEYSKYLLNFKQLTFINIYF